MAEIRVPTLGESVTEATIGKWFKKPGDAVAVDEPLVELETDKVTIEVPAPAAGVLGDIAAKDGETVAVGAMLGADQGGRRRRPTGEAQLRRPSRAKATGRRGPPPAAAARGAAAPPTRRRRRCAAGAVGAQDSPRSPASMPQPCPAPARTAASPRATCWRRSSAPPRNRRRSPRPPPPSRCARRRRPTMPRARSACA